MTRAALLLMDLQHGILGRYGDVSAYLERVAATAASARAAGVPVIHVAVRFRDGHPEVSRRNLMFAAAADAGGLLASEEAGQFVDATRPQDGDVVVTKRRVSAFAGSDLDVVLRGLDVDHLVLAGVATSGVVLSTVRQAADLDLELTVLADGCLDMDPEVHRVLVDSVFPKQAAVTTTEEWVAALGDGPA
jgi:nicotinamidase-related amidase